MIDQITVEIIDHVHKSILPDYSLSTYKEVGTPCCFLTGAAGTGKSTLLQRAAEDDPKFGLFTSSTGIAAINLASSGSLSATTVHSALGFFNADTCRAAYNDGWLHKAIKKRIQAEDLKWLVIDEISMLPGSILQSIYAAVDEVNKERWDLPPVGILLTGDPLQLSPIQDDLIIGGKKVLDEKSHKPKKAPVDWPYTQQCWREFEKGTIRLEKIWRQDNPLFLRALGEIRKGNGMTGAQFLKLAGVKFFNSLEELPLEDGFANVGCGNNETVICGTNRMVDKINLLALENELGESFVLESKRWFCRKYQPQEWKHVPDMMELKIGALVMILVNNAPKFDYVNGDLGRIVEVLRPTINHPEFDEGKAMDYSKELIDAIEEPSDWHPPVMIRVQLLRNSQIVSIPQITRHCWQFNAPNDWEKVQNVDRVCQDRVPGVRRKVWILGELTYFPIRLAYASTVEKTQGLTLDRIQIRLNDWCLGMPQKMYVALSRCRSPEGISLIGTPGQLAKMVRIHDELRRFL